LLAIFVLFYWPNSLASVFALQFIGSTLWPVFCAFGLRLILSDLSSEVEGNKKGQYRFVTILAFGVISLRYSIESLPLRLMPLLREPDIRLGRNAYDLKKANIAGLHWTSVIDQHIADPSHILMSQYLKKDEAEFGGKEGRIAACPGTLALSPRPAYEQRCSPKISYVHPLPFEGRNTI
jgi:hypothetical protein